MDSQALGNIAAAMGERSGFFRLLSSLYFKEVDDDFIAALKALPAELSQEEGMLGEGFAELRGFMAHKGPDPRTDLACDYARVFLAAGMFEGDAGCPFESIYTSEDKLIMQEARDEVRAIYLQNAVNVDESLHLPEDHLSFELEFLAIMGDRAADSARKGDAGALLANLRVQRDFEDEHLLNWIGDLAERVEELSRFRFYPAVMRITRGYLEQDCALLDELVGQLEAEGGQEGGHDD